MAGFYKCCGTVFCIDIEPGPPFGQKFHCFDPSVGRGLDERGSAAIVKSVYIDPFDQQEPDHFDMAGTGRHNEGGISIFTLSIHIDVQAVQFLDHIQPTAKGSNH